MVIEDMQQSLELLENIKYFFYNIEEINEIIPMLDKNGGMKTAYKKVESWKEL